jgi:hypothetical protein
MLYTITSHNIRQNLSQMVGQEFSSRSFAEKFGYITDETPESEHTPIISRIANELAKCRSKEDTFNNAKMKGKHAHFMTAMGIRLKVVRIADSNDGYGASYIYRADAIDDAPKVKTIENSYPSFIQIDFDEMVKAIPDETFMKEISRRFGS